MQRLTVALAAITALAGCGAGSTEAPASSGSSSGASGASGAVGCTEIGCANGVQVEFSYRDPGTYRFEVIIDGSKATCAATIPLPREAPRACDREDVLLGLVGSMLPVSQQSVGGLILSTTTATTITVRASRDGTLLGEKTFTPPYRVSPGPNGPNCEPKECKQATVAFP